MNITPTDFMAAAPRALNGNSPWAQRYAAEVKRVVTEHAARAPRSLQRHLGPSELGVECDRQAAGKMAGLPKTNNVVDPWPSIVGTAVHAWLADAFAGDNKRSGVLRWAPEVRVTPHPNHPGTADLYDAVEQTVGDHKCLGESSLSKVRSANGPSRKYVVQLLLYAVGYRNLGFPVRRVALIAYPRTKSSLDDMYVWERPHTPADDALIQEVFNQTATRQDYARLLHSGQVQLLDIPATVDDQECVWCPFYRPQAARDGRGGCPGSVKSN